MPEQLDFAWNSQLQPRMQGLTDDEYLQEPVNPCWSIRQDHSGSWVFDLESNKPTPPPFTTIAWRLLHIAFPIFGLRASTHFGDGSLSLENVKIPGTADEAMAFLTEQYRNWHGVAADLNDDGLSQPSGPAEGQFANAFIATLVLHFTREFIHHAAK